MIIIAVVSAGNGPLLGVVSLKVEIVILKEKSAPKSYGLKAEHSSSGTRNLSGADFSYFAESNG